MAILRTARNTRVQRADRSGEFRDGIGQLTTNCPGGVRETKEGLSGGKKRTGNGSRPGRPCHSSMRGKQDRGPRFMHDEVKSYVFAPEASGPDVYDSKLHGYRYSRYACSAETCISCPRAKSLVLFPSLLL